MNIYQQARESLRKLHDKKAYRQMFVKLEAAKFYLQQRIKERMKAK